MLVTMIRFSMLSLFFGPLLWSMTTHLPAQVDIFVDHSTVGLGPGEVIADTLRDRVHVLTSGHDMNLNGHFEPDNGDISAGWYVLDVKGNILDSALFNEFFNDYPIRVGADLERNLLYLPLKGRVQVYSMETLGLVIDALVHGNVSAVSYDPNAEVLILSRRASDFTSPGQVQVVDPASGFVLGDIISGINPGMGVFDTDMMNGITSMYVLNEGSSSVENSSLTRLSFANDIYKAVNGKEMGDGGKQILYDEKEEQIFILLPRAGLVRILEAGTHKEIKESPVVIEDFDDPRSLAVDGDFLWISFWDGAVRCYSLEDGSKRQYGLPGKGEGIAVQNGRLFVAISYAADSFEPDSTLIVFDLQTNEPIDTIAVGLNPISVFSNPRDNGVLVMGSGGNGVGPWWKEINAMTLETRGSGPLPASVGNPVQAAFDKENTTFAVIGADTLFTLNLRTDVDGPSPLYVDSNRRFSRVANSDEHWLLTNSVGDFSPEVLRLYAIEKRRGERVVSIAIEGASTGGESISMIPGPAKAPLDGGFAAYVITESSREVPYPELVYVEYHPNLFENKLGNVANHILHEVDEYGDGITAVTMNGSHEVVFLDLNLDQPEISFRVPTGTKGFDGPRASAVAPCVPVDYRGALLVTTYSGEVLFLANEQVVVRKGIGGKGEGIAVLKDTVFIANAFKTSTYNPASTVAIVTLTYPGSVDEIESIISSIHAYPNPANATGTIVLTLERPADVELSLYDPLGRPHKKLFSGRLEAGVSRLPLDVSDLESGTYFYRLQVDGKSVTQLLQVVR